MSRDEFRSPILYNKKPPREAQLARYVDPASYVQSFEHRVSRGEEILLDVIHSSVADLETGLYTTLYIVKKLDERVLLHCSHLSSSRRTPPKNDPPPVEYYLSRLIRSKDAEIKRRTFMTLQSLVHSSENPTRPPRAQLTLVTNFTRYERSTALARGQPPALRYKKSGLKELTPRQRVRLNTPQPKRPFDTPRTMRAKSLKTPSRISAPLRILRELNTIDTDVKIRFLTITSDFDDGNGVFWCIGRFDALDGKLVIAESLYHVKTAKSSRVTREIKIFRRKVQKQHALYTRRYFTSTPLDEHKIGSGFPADLRSEGEHFNRHYDRPKKPAPPLKKTKPKPDHRLPAPTRVPGLPLPPADPRTLSSPSAPRYPGTSRPTPRVRPVKD